MRLLWVSRKKGCNLLRPHKNMKGKVDKNSKRVRGQYGES